MERASEDILRAVVAAEVSHGEAAEAFAREQAERAARAGKAGEAAAWQKAAAELHILHTINQPL